jgi:hypothetical protein
MVLESCGKEGYMTGEGSTGTIRGVSEKDLNNWFTYHAPKPEQLPKYAAIRDAGKELATVILKNTPSSPDQTAAIRLIREAVMTANQCIACEGG